MLKQIWIWKFEKHIFCDHKKKKNTFDIITHIINVHKYVADAETTYLFWPHTGLHKYSYYAA